MSDSSSFFDKLKKGMEIAEEVTPEEPIAAGPAAEEEIIEEKPINKSPKVIKKPTVKKTKKEKVPEFKVEKIKEESPTKKEEDLKPWTASEEEGQLTVDMYQTDNDIIIQSAIAGVKLEDLDISIENDVFTVRGTRKKYHHEDSHYLLQECFWGNFSRQIILPVEVNPSLTKASFKDGVLTVKIPKLNREKKLKIDISS